MEIIRKAFHRITHRPYLTPELRALTGGELLLHVSDTPREIHSFVLRLLDAIRPAVFVHTGDFVDDVKLEHAPERRHIHEHYLKRLIERIELRAFCHAYYVPGNHDDADILRSASRTGTVIEVPREKTEVVRIAGHRFALGHDIPRNLPECDYALYGHVYGHVHLMNGAAAKNGALIAPGNSGEEDGTFGNDGVHRGRRRSRPYLLNGLERVNVVDLRSETVYHVDYPMDTDRYRKLHEGPVGI